MRARNPSVCLGLVTALVAAGFIYVLSVLGCGPGLDRVYALPLEHPPTDRDWSGAIAYRTEAVGGRTTRPGEADVDSDAVHKATASCHHGSGAPPVAVELKAFHTAEALYLQVSWADLTLHRGPSWRWNGSSWVAGGFGEDGVGILWGGERPDFSCTRACHLSDWRMAGPRGFADYAMAAPAEWGELDLWVWKAGRKGAGGAAEDARIAGNGRAGDGEGDLFLPNSTRARSGEGDAFRAGDGPVWTPAPEPDAWAPAFLVREHPEAGRTEVAAEGRWESGRWTVTFRRALAGRDAGDVVLRPGQDVTFGLALLDGVSLDHNAVPETLRLRVVARDELSGAVGDGK